MDGVQQLTSADAQFLALESARQTGHLGFLSILDPSTAPGGTIGAAELQALIAERIPLVRPLRWRLAEVPFGLDLPYWMDDPDFDLDFHVRELALPSPGTEAQLSEQIARIGARPLDRTRPLWELYLIHGLDSGHVAMLAKIHHALVDGLSGIEVMNVLMDRTPDGRPAPAEATPDGGRPPTPTELAFRGLTGLPRYSLRLARSLPRALPHLEGTPFRSPRDAPPRVRTPFNDRVSPHRRYAFGSLALEDFRAVQSLHGGTINDVLVSISAGALRRWLVEHAELPSEGPLTLLVPFSVRSEEHAGTYGNRVLSMTAPLRTDVADPVERLAATRAAMDEVKLRHRRLPPRLREYLADLIPPAVFSRVARVGFRLLSSDAFKPAYNVVVTNMRGPAGQLYCAGARVLSNHPSSLVTDGMGLCIAVMSYAGSLDFTVVTDRDQVKDVRTIADWLGDELAVLRESAVREPVG